MRVCTNGFGLCANPFLVPRNSFRHILLRWREFRKTQFATALAGARRQDGGGLRVVGPTKGSARMPRLVEYSADRPDASPRLTRGEAEPHSSQRTL